MSVPASAVLHASQRGQPYQNAGYPGYAYPPPTSYPANYAYTPGTGYPPTSAYPPGSGYPSAGGYPPSGAPNTYHSYAQPITYGAQSYYQEHPYPQVYDPYGNNVGKSSLNSKASGGKPNAQNPISYDTANSEMISVDTSTSIRHSFVRKVYLILSTQLLYSFGFALLFSLVDPLRKWLKVYWWVALIFCLVGFVLIIVVTCCSNLARQFPTNFILLSLITICMSWILAVALGAARTSSISFAIAAGITAAVVVGLTIFAIQTKWDFTGCSVFVLVAAIILILFGILAALFQNRILHIVYASLGAALFSFFLVYDTQQIVGGKHRKYQYSIDDYILGALTLYMDVINLFMFILSLVGAAQD